MDYLNTLDVNAIWINPCFCLSFHDGGYDVTDFATSIRVLERMPIWICSLLKHTGERYVFVSIASPDTPRSIIHGFAHPRRTYRYCSEDILYPFGFGLSYTDFAYSGLTADQEGGSSEGIACRLLVRNTGKYAGENTVLFFFRHEGAGEDDFPSRTTNPSSGTECKKTT